ncbi:hypothetical protein ACIRPR_30075 [Streptomyces griseoflavus]|uniref:hypothetical protein n=1 Tax=Streptomyces griseoflavus TaxID=35619 RepID=UPI00167E7C8F|nr:hypothetical protein [Streptomyces griseoflavus]GGV43230.1 hypothetical protein GCM10010293_49720 [Streptomyces griseoflavus]
MRTRHALTGAALGAVMALGVLGAPAQAAPIQAKPSASAAVSINTPSTSQAYEYYGSYRWQFECNFAGNQSGYSRWYCAYSNYSGFYELFVDYRS